MGACLSVNTGDERNGSASQLWNCFRASPAPRGDEEEVKEETVAAGPAELRDPDSGSLQPQRRPETVSSRIDSDRNQHTTTSGQWFAEPITPRRAEKEDEVAVEAAPVPSPKKRKRSLSQVLYRQLHQPRPQTAPEQRNPDWRVSLRLWGTQSPFPDFSSFKVPGIDDADNDSDNDDLRSSYTYVNTNSAPSSPTTSPPWPLPNDPAACPALEDTEQKLEQGRNSKTGQSEEHDLRPSLDSTPSPPRPRRSRAISDPFRYARRKRASTSRSEKQAINDEIRELRVLVEAKKKNTKSISIDNPTTTNTSDATGPSGHEHTGSLTRSKSKGHVPAIAPSMTVRVRSQVLSDIGSAFSKPLDDGPAPRTPIADTDDNAVSKVSPLRATAPAQTQPAKAKRPRQKQKQKSHTAAAPAVSQKDIAEWAAAAAVATSQPQQLPAKARTLMPPTPLPTPTQTQPQPGDARFSTASHISTSEFPVAPSSLARFADASAAAPQQQQQLAHAPVKRTSNILSGIWGGARDKDGRRISEVKPPPPLKATMKRRG